MNEEFKKFIQEEVKKLHQITLLENEKIQIEKELKILEEGSDEKNKELTYKKISGYVGQTPVTAYVYPGADYGLSHYVIDGKTNFGTVVFTKITNEKEIKYK